MPEREAGEGAEPGRQLRSGTGACHVQLPHLCRYPATNSDTAITPARDAQACIRPGDDGVVPEGPKGRKYMFCTRAITWPGRERARLSNREGEGADER